MESIDNNTPDFYRLKYEDERVKYKENRLQINQLDYDQQTKRIEEYHKINVQEYEREIKRIEELYEINQLNYEKGNKRIEEFHKLNKIHYEEECKYIEEEPVIRLFIFKDVVNRYLMLKPGKCIEKNYMRQLLTNEEYIDYHEPEFEVIQSDTDWELKPITEDPYACFSLMRSCDNCLRSISVRDKQPHPIKLDGRYTVDIFYITSKGISERIQLRGLDYCDSMS